jgi:uncharacterized membrane protein YphA (DoxX/SURF4 family)
MRMKALNLSSPGKRLDVKKITVEIITSLFIILFIYTGLNKMMDFSNFKFQLGRSPFIQSMSGFLAFALPLGEILASLALIIRKTRLLGLYASFTLMCLFTGYIWIMLHYAYDLPCSCGGILAALSWHDHLLFNSAFTILGMIGVLLQNDLENKLTAKTTASA